MIKKLILDLDKENLFLQIENQKHRRKIQFYTDYDKPFIQIHEVSKTHLSNKECPNIIGKGWYLYPKTDALLLKRILSKHKVSFDLNNSSISAGTLSSTSIQLKNGETLEYSNNVHFYNLKKESEGNTLPKIYSFNILNKDDRTFHFSLEKSLKEFFEALYKRNTFPENNYVTNNRENNYLSTIEKKDFIIRFAGNNPHLISTTTIGHCLNNEIVTSLVYRNIINYEAGDINISSLIARNHDAVTTVRRLDEDRSTFSNAPWERFNNTTGITATQRRNVERITSRRPATVQPGISFRYGSLDLGSSHGANSPAFNVERIERVIENLETANISRESDNLTNNTQ